MSQPLRLVYTGWLPDPHATHWSPRYRLKRRALKTFGVMPLSPPGYAYVTITRVLGRRQHLMDDDKLSWQLRGLRDALKGGKYIWDDSPTHARFAYQQDANRRHEGPRIEVVVSYEEGGR